MIRLSNPLTNATGGAGIRTAAEFFHGAVRESLLAGGPIDAPQWLPAGSVTGVETRDWKGGPVASVTLARRTGGYFD